MNSLSSFVLGLLVLPNLISAGPLVKRGISSDDYAKISLYEQYSAASYCPNDNNKGTVASKITCDAGNCPDVQSADTITVVEFEKTTRTDTSGFVAIDNTNALIVVSFRGSESWRNYLADLNLPLTPTNLCPGCAGAAGFLDAWSEVATTVAAAVKTAHAAHPDYRIVSTGHSLGGAIATLAALDLRKQGFVVDMGTFGAPRVGTDSMARLMSGQDPAQGRNFRVTHKYDPVPSMPALSEGYRHVTPAYHIMTDNTAVPTAKDFEMQVGMLFENAWGLNLVEDGEAHVHYFNHISACYANGTSGGIVW